MARIVKDRLGYWFAVSGVGSLIAPAVVQAFTSGVIGVPAVLFVIGSFVLAAWAFRFIMAAEEGAGDP